MITSVAVTLRDTSITSGVTFTATRVPNGGITYIGGITSMTVYAIGATTTTYFNLAQSMRIGVGETLNISVTATIPHDALVTGDITLY